LQLGDQGVGIFNKSVSLLLKDKLGGQEQTLNSGMALISKSRGLLTVSRALTQNQGENVIECPNHNRERKKYRQY